MRANMTNLANSSISNLLSDVKKWGGKKENHQKNSPSKSSHMKSPCWLNRAGIQAFCTKREKETNSVIICISESKVPLDDDCLANAPKCWVRWLSIQVENTPFIHWELPAVTVLGKQARETLRIRVRSKGAHKMHCWVPGDASVDLGRECRLVCWSRMPAI